MKNQMTRFKLKLVYLKQAIPSLFFIFSNIKSSLEQIIVKTQPSSIWCWDSYSQPLGHEDSPINNRLEHGSWSTIASLCCLKLRFG